MFSTTSTLTTTALLAALSLAAPAPIKRDGTLPQFNLTATDCNGKYVDTPLVTIHVGPGFDAIVPGSAPYEPFYINGTDYFFSSPYSQPFYIQYNVPASPSPMVDQVNLIQNDNTSNVLSLMFVPGNGNPAVFSFGGDEAVLNAYDDGHPSSAAQQSYSPKFYICPTEYLGDTYQMLSYVAGGATPDNTECDEVTVQKAEN